MQIQYIKCGYLHPFCPVIKGGGTNISGKGAKLPPPPIFLGQMLQKEYDTVRSGKERIAKCEIKSNHLEKLNNKACCTKAQLVLNVNYSLCKHYSWGHGSAFKFIT